MIGASTTPIWLSIMVAGIAAGSVDVMAAAMINHVGPGIVLQAIASGLWGKASFTGGSTTMVAGLILQWAMSMIIAAVFLIAVKRLSWLVRQPLVAGMVYGVGVYLVMTYVVVPLSRARSKPDVSIGHIAADLVAMMVFGVIVAMTPSAIAAVRQAAHRSS